MPTIDFINAELRNDYPTAYAPQGYKLKDFSIIRAPAPGSGSAADRSAGLFHLYYIKTPQAVPNDYVLGLENMIGHSTTPDFLHWQDHDPILISLQLSWESRCVIAPYVLRHGSEWWMFYTGTNDHRSRLGIATSPDLFHWARHPINPVYDPSCLPFAAPRGGGCRDPHVAKFSGKLGDTYHLYYTIDSQDDTACVGVATSTDLLDWRDAGLALISPHRSESGKHATCAESSAVHEIDGRYLMTVKHCCDQGKCNHGSFLIWSDSPTRFDWEKRFCWLDRVIAMELVARKGDDFLFACFSCVWWKFHLIKLTRNGDRFGMKENLDQHEVAELMAP